MIPIKVSMIPLMKPRAIDVCTAMLVFSSCLPPKYLATMTLAPMESPMKRFVTRFISAELEPTAASAVSPTNFPTTTMSAALNRICSTLENMSGMENIRIFVKTGPSVISMV